MRRGFWLFFVGLVCFVLALLLFGYPSEKELRQENARLLAQYKLLSARLNQSMEVLQDIGERDDNLYRVVFQGEPVSSEIRNSGYLGTNRYDDLKDMANAEMVIETTRKLDVLDKQLYLQSTSFDQVVEMCRNQEEMLKCIPAIQPVANKDLKRMASGYGTRIDPIYGTTRFHEGMDFSAPTGTDIYATGDGVVVKMGWQTGYGNTIVIDHGFGYQTLYAHMKEFRTQRGKRVVRGEVIGGVGNTGKSSGPHLHYEVHKDGRVVNPVNYYFKDLSAEDYDRMIQMAENHGKMMD
ncbi:MAG: M23 family metallopeptidase [Bacteroides sp.]|nr:M23 family metallopeptidase [Bacteroides sp.]